MAVDSNGEPTTPHLLVDAGRDELPPPTARDRIPRRGSGFIEAAGRAAKAATLRLLGALVVAVPGMLVAMLPPHLVPVLEILRRAYPDGLPDSDYLPLLAALQADLCEANLATVVADLIDGEAVVVDNDAAAAAWKRRPPPREVERVRRLLISVGYPREDLYPQDW